MDTIYVKSIFRNVASLKIPAHDVINALCYRVRCEVQSVQKVRPPPPPLHLYTPPYMARLSPPQYGNKHENKPTRKVISSCLEDYKITLHAFFISNTF